MTHWCPRCKTARPRAAFHRNRTRPTGQASWCKACVSEYQAAQYARAHGYQYIPWRRKEETA